MARRTEFGKELLSGQWAVAEFEALGTLWDLGLPVPYPVQLSDREMLMEFIGSDGEAAPRLAQTRPDPDLLAELFEQLRATLTTLARRGWAHGDLSPYNVLLHDERLVIIDWPQIVDIIGNPRGFEFLERDVANMSRWFTSKGLAVDEGELSATSSRRRPRAGADPAAYRPRLGLGHDLADPSAVLAGALGGAALGLAGCGVGAERGCDSSGTLVSSHWPGRDIRWQIAQPEDDGDQRRRWWWCCTARVATPATPSGSCTSTTTPSAARLTLASVDGGDYYWHARRAGMDTGAMVVEDFLPLVARETGYAGPVAFLGWSMGGYGSLLLASELGPDRVSAVVAESAALWTEPGLSAPGAFDDRDDFEAHDVFERTAVLAQIPVRLDCGRSDPFVAGNKAFAARPCPRPGSPSTRAATPRRTGRATGRPSCAGSASSSTPDPAGVSRRRRVHRSA